MELDRSWKDQLDNRVNENVKNHIKVLKTEMDIMGEKIIEKDEKEKVCKTDVFHNFTPCSEVPK